jgi:hypothetical protein
MRRRDVGKVERRILPQQNDVELGELRPLRLAQGEMITRPVAH